MDVYQVRCSLRIKFLDRVLKLLLGRVTIGGSDRGRFLFSTDSDWDMGWVVVRPGPGLYYVEGVIKDARGEENWIVFINTYYGPEALHWGGLLGH